MFCRNCGQENSKENIFCKSCGNKLETTTEEKSVSVNTNEEKNKNNIMPFILIGVAVLVFVIAGILILKSFNKKSSAKSGFESGLIRIIEDGKYGYINLDGKVVIEPTLEYGSDFKDGYAIIYRPEIVEGVERNMYSIIDERGNSKLILRLDPTIKTVTNDNKKYYIIDDKLYDSNFKQLTADGLRIRVVGENIIEYNDSDNKEAGIMNFSGKKVYTYKFTGSENYINVNVSDSIFDEKYCRINIDNKKNAIVNCLTGEVIYDFTDIMDKYISVSKGNIFKVEEYSTSKFITKFYVQNNKIFYEAQDSSTYIEYVSKGYIKIITKDPEKSYYSRIYKYIDPKKGVIQDEVPETDLESTLSAVEKLIGYSKFSCDAGYGIMKDKSIIVPCEWSRIYFLGTDLYGYLKDKYVVGKKNDSYYLIQLGKNKTVEFKTTDLHYGNSIFVYYKDKETNKYVVYNIESGKQSEYENATSVSVYKNYFIVKDSEGSKYYNKNFKLIYTSAK